MGRQRRLRARRRSRRQQRRPNPQPVGGAAGRRTTFRFETPERRAADAADWRSK